MGGTIKKLIVCAIIFAQSFLFPLSALATTFIPPSSGTLPTYLYNSDGSVNYSPDLKWGVGPIPHVLTDYEKRIFLVDEYIKDFSYLSEVKYSLLVRAKDTAIKTIEGFDKTLAYYAWDIAPSEIRRYFTTVSDIAFNLGRGLTLETALKYAQTTLIEYNTTLVKYRNADSRLNKIPLPEAPIGKSGQWHVDDPTLNAGSKEPSKLVQMTKQAMEKGKDLFKDTGVKIKVVLVKAKEINKYINKAFKPIVEETRSAFEDWVIDIGDAGQLMYNTSQAWKLVMDHPITTGVVVGVGAGIVALGAAAGITALSTAYLSGAGTVCIALCNQAEKLTQTANTVTNQAINITSDGMLHIQKFHSLDSAVTQETNRSYFYSFKDVPQLLQKAENATTNLQDHGTYQRIIDAGQAIGWDMVTKSATSIYSVITDKAGVLITSFPGK